MAVYFGIHLTTLVLSVMGLYFLACQS